MAILIPILVGCAVALISYWWINLQKVRNKLKWLPEVPRVPILGNALELGDTKKVLNKFSKYCLTYDGLCTMELINNKFIIASNPEFLEFLLSRTEILDKTHEYSFLDNWLGTGILTADTEKWVKFRKIIQPAFHFSILETFIEVFNKNVNILVEILEKEVNKEYIDVFPFVAMSTLDIICETTMGTSINAQRNPKSDYTLAVKEKCRILIDRTYSPYKRFDLLYPLSSDYYKEKEYVKILHSFALKVIGERKQAMKEAKEHQSDGNGDDLGIKKRKAFLDLLLEASVDGRPLTDEEIRQEVDTFMFAGHDTTASSISFTLYCLSKHPEVQNKVVEEQKKIFGNDRNRPITYKDLQEMKYLEMVIKESLRMYPPVPYTGRCPKRDVTYKDGNVIPKDTGILVMIYCANRNPKIFPDPDTFNPDRFEEGKSYSQYAYIPFSAGPRNCVGQKYAMFELKTVLSTIVRNFELLPSGQDLTLVAETVLKSVNGVNIKLKKRENWDD